MATEDSWNLDFNWGDVWNGISSVLPKDSSGNTNWSGLLGAGLNTYQTMNNINTQKDLGNQIIDMTKFKPYNVTTNMGTSVFNPNTNTAAASLSPALQGMFDSILGKANEGYSGINLDPAANTQGALELLRGLSAPEEARARTDLESRLLGQGRLGSTGGGIEQEALAKAQGNTDLQRQLQAITLGQNIVNNRVNNSNSLLGAGLNLGQIPTSLISSGAQLGSAAAGAAGQGAEALYKTSQAAQDLRSLLFSSLFGGAGGGGTAGGTRTGTSGGATGTGSALNPLINSLVNSGAKYIGNNIGDWWNTLTSSSGDTSIPLDWYGNYDAGSFGDWSGLGGENLGSYSDNGFGNWVDTGSSAGAADVPFGSGSEAGASSAGYGFGDVASSAGTALSLYRVANGQGTPMDYITLARQGYSLATSAGMLGGVGGSGLTAAQMSALSSQAAASLAGAGELALTGTAASTAGTTAAGTTAAASSGSSAGAGAAAGGAWVFALPAIGAAIAAQQDANEKKDSLAGASRTLQRLSAAGVPLDQLVNYSLSRASNENVYQNYKSGLDNGLLRTPEQFINSSFLAAPMTFDQSKFMEFINSVPGAAAQLPGDIYNDFMGDTLQNTNDFGLGWIRNLLEQGNAQYSQYIPTLQNLIGSDPRFNQAYQERLNYLSSIDQAAQDKMMYGNSP